LGGGLIMASFPIFLDLAQARAPLIVGGGDLALIKAQLILKRAARVTFAAHQIVPGIAGLIANGRAEQMPSGPREADVRGRPLVISASGDPAEDARVSTLARSLGVPVNVPDRPELCTFALGAIVDRGLVTVAIGTDGAAPVLATHLRARLERELHPRLGRLAELARAFRPAVAARLPPGAARRDFWGRIFDGPAADAVLAGDEVKGRDLIEQALTATTTAKPKQGRVVLVGAGPGDPDLLTLKAVRALKSADVILHDGAMGDAVLDHARREAQLISVAKARGRHSKTQAEINAMIVALAREGKTVVRLKGGDPFVFGRGGEEVDILRASGIAVEVVPGITAATAAAASLQIPLTHRDIARSVTFLSGHAADDGAPTFDQMDFTALAQRGATLAVYMGLATSAALATTLLDAGWSRATPLIALSRVSQAGERRVSTTLDVLASHPDGLGLTGPTLLIIGEVASLAAAGVVERLTETAPSQRPREVAHA
jgi:uroporphyrin-III C-methyltransferase / precorrin-2 dehydrogenase / sirohydrochlorin ferrochelatase